MVSRTSQSHFGVRTFAIYIKIHRSKRHFKLFGELTPHRACVMVGVVLCWGEAAGDSSKNLKGCYTSDTLQLRFVYVRLGSTMECTVNNCSLHPTPAAPLQPTPYGLPGIQWGVPAEC